MLVRPMHSGIQTPDFSLVFPAYNPGPLIESTWRQVDAFRNQTHGKWEFIFVCDGCTDQTAERLQALAHTASDVVRVLSYEQNRGKGYAVRLGLQAARGRWRIFTDIDLAYGFADVMRLAQELENGAEVAIASRNHPESRLLLPPGLLSYVQRRRLQSRLFTAIVHCLLPIRNSDTQAGLKGLSARAAELVLPRLRCKGFEFDCELLTACQRLGLTVAEVPVTVQYENALSTTGVRAVFTMLRKLWRIRQDWRVVPPVEPLTLPIVLNRNAA